jgi:hypothetical protein
MRRRLETPAARSHQVKLPRTRDEALVLRYGGTDATDRHETTIRPRPSPARVSWGAADSIVVVSDVHGEFAQLARVLRNAAILDEQFRWVGGRKHLVVAGDMVDRGEESTRLLWLLYGLEAQAERAGGRVHVVLGNHELMIMSGDLRYVAPKEQRIASLHGVPYPDLFDPHRSVLGRWLTSRPPALRIGDVLIAHGGISAKYRDWSLNAMRDSLARFTHEELFVRWGDSTYAVPLNSAAYQRRWDFFWDDRSIFWYRGYAQSDSAGAELALVLDRFDAQLHVIGHTPSGSIESRYNGALIGVNTVPFAKEALLLVRQGRAWNRFRIRETGPPEPL